MAWWGAGWGSRWCGARVGVGVARFVPAVLVLGLLGMGRS